jgi:hypothetical protein
VGRTTPEKMVGCQSFRSYDVAGSHNLTSRLCSCRCPETCDAEVTALVRRTSSQRLEARWNDRLALETRSVRHVDFEEGSGTADARWDWT